VDLAPGNLTSTHLTVSGRLFGLELAEDATDHAPFRGGLATRGAEVGEDVLPETHRPLDLPVLQRLAHAVHALQVLRIADEHDHRAVFASEGEPDITLQVLAIEVAHEICRRDELLFALV